jgi:hypothetical protein
MPEDAEHDHLHAAMADWIAHAREHREACVKYDKGCMPPVVIALGPTGEFILKTANVPVPDFRNRSPRDQALGAARLVARGMNPHRLLLFVDVYQQLLPSDRDVSGGGSMGRSHASGTGAADGIGEAVDIVSVDRAGAVTTTVLPYERRGAAVTWFPESDHTRPAAGSPADPDAGGYLARALRGIMAEPLYADSPGFADAARDYGDGGTTREAVERACARLAIAKLTVDHSCLIWAPEERYGADMEKLVNQYRKATEPFSPDMIKQMVNRFIESERRKRATHVYKHGGRVTDGPPDDRRRGRGATRPPQ